MSVIGAILGDIAGQPFEFNHKPVDYEHVELFTAKNHLTDDTVLTVATLHALKDKTSFQDAYYSYGRAYYDRGYGNMFKEWLNSDDLAPYNSYGNGSAMRVSPVIDFADSKEEVIKLAAQSAVVTHNHPEGIKGAVVTAVCGWMARNGASKNEILEYGTKQYPPEDYKYSCSQPLDVIREKYRWNATCQDCVPVAIRCFYESESFEGFLRKTISMLGDTDTLGAIGGCFAGEYYKLYLDGALPILRRYLDVTMLDDLQVLEDMKK